MSKPKVIAFDLDGTLAESKSPITPKMAGLISKLLDKYKVIVISGGNIEQFQTQFLALLPKDTRLDNLYLITDSGGEIYSCHDRKCQLVHSSPMSSVDKELIRKAISKSLNEVSWELPKQLWGEQIQDRGSEITFSALGQTAPLADKQLWDPEHSKRAELAMLIRAKLPNFEVREGGITSIDITQKGTTKKSALIKYLDYNSLTSDDILYVGDALFPGGNDSVVKELLANTKSVKGPDETAVIIAELLEE